MEGKDSATLESFLTRKAPTQRSLNFYKMMQSGGAGEKIAKIELVSLTSEDVKKHLRRWIRPAAEKFVCRSSRPRSS